MWKSANFLSAKFRENQMFANNAKFSRNPKLQKNRLDVFTVHDAEKSQTHVTAFTVFKKWILADIIIYLLAWELSAAKVLKVYPNLNHFTRKINFRYLCRPTQLKISKPVGLPSFQIKIWCKSVQGFLSNDRTNKQTNR